MNFTFTDISSSILNMVQPERFQSVMPGAKNQGPSDHLFAQKLSKILEKGKGLQNQGLSVATLEDLPEESQKRVDRLIRKLTPKKGVAFLSELKNVFMNLSKGDLKNISIDAKGLETLKKLLFNAGFDALELDELMAELTEGLEENNLTMDDLFDKLFTLSMDSDSDFEIKPEQFIEISALPFIESILIALDIPVEKVQEILTAADNGEKGFSLDGIIAKLKEVQKNAFYTHTSYQTKAGDEQFQSILKQLGIGAQQSKELKVAQPGIGAQQSKESKVAQPGIGAQQSKELTVAQLEIGAQQLIASKVAQQGIETQQSKEFTLNDLINAFETMRNQLSRQKTTETASPAMSPQMSGTEKTADLVKDLFKGLEVKNLPKEKQVFEFSLDGIKKQFEADLLNEDDGKSNQKGLFSTPKPTRTENIELIKHGLKEITSELDEKGSKTSLLKDAAIDGKEFAKHLKSRASSLTDQTQASFYDSKSSETQNHQAILKSNASFKNLPNFVMQQVSKSIVRAINQGENTLKIQLNPPELGRLMLTIDNSGGNMKVSIVTENAAAKEILVSNSNELRTVLSNSGVTLERFEVDMNSDFRQSMADAKSQENFNKRQQNTGNQKLESVTGGIVNDTSGLSLMEAINLGKSLHFVA
ncbi:MAG: flagellar hook-length control protein FliK [Pseudomonadota bacterium]